MKQKPSLSFWQIWNMSFGFLGIQFGFALQNANVSRIFETLGAEIENIPILWIAAPVTGLIVQPIIGHMSDKTWGRFGRRRPYFMIGAILASLALFVMPNSPALWVAAGMLWIMDASINISMEPFRAFVGDMLPSRQRTRGFAMQSFFIGIGAFVASYLPYVMTNWFNLANTAPEGEIAVSVRASFYLGGIVFFLAVLWTTLKTKEYSPEELEAFEQEKEKALEEKAKEDLIETRDSHPSERRFMRRGIIWTTIGLITNFMVYWFSLESELYILTGGLFLFGFLQLISGLLTKQGKTQNGLVSIMRDVNVMPKTMAQLAMVQFFSWFALFAMWIYTTSAVTSHLYGTLDPTSLDYNVGADWVGAMFGWYNLFAAAFSFLLPVLARKTNRKVTHMISLLAGGVGLASIYVVQDPKFLIIPMLGIGLAWASILSMPYAILTGSLPQNKMGVYMGIFNFFIVIPQIMAASILGFLVKGLFQEQTIFALLLGGVSMIIAAIWVLFVNDKEA
ncbi:MAG: MFS transporter [Bacteroidota bacterium]